VDTSGELDQARQEARLKGDNPDLTVSATDEADNPTVATSGVQNINVVFNSNATSPANQSFSQACPQGGCSLTHTFNLNTSSLPEGSNTVDVTTTDAAGNADDQTWTFNVDRTTGLPSCSDPTADPNNCQASPPSQNTAACKPGLPLVPGGVSQTAVDYANQHLPQALAPSDSVTQEGLTLAPALTTLPGRLVSSATIMPSEVTSLATPSYSVGSGTTGVCLTSALAGTGGQQLSNAVVYGNTTAGADTVLRPSPFGMQEIQQIRDTTAPDTYAEQVSLQPGQSLQQLSDGSIAVIDPSIQSISSAQGPYDPGPGQLSPSTADDASITSRPGIDDPGTALTDDDFAGITPSSDYVQPQQTQFQYDVENALQHSSDQETDGQQVATIAPPSASDATGADVPVSQAITAPNIITMTVGHHSATYSYPVYTRRSTTSASAARRQPSSYGLSDQNAQSFDVQKGTSGEGGPKLRSALRAQFARLIFPAYYICDGYDPSHPPAPSTDCGKAITWVNAAVADHLTPYISVYWGFVNNSRPNPPSKYPTGGPRSNVVASLSQIWRLPPFNKVKFWAPMNEPNLADQPGGGDANLAARIYGRAKAAGRSRKIGCGPCHIVAGELVGQPSVFAKKQGYLHDFIVDLKAAHSAPAYWSLHDYNDVRYGRKSKSSDCPPASNANPPPHCVAIDYPAAQMFTKTVNGAYNKRVRFLFSESGVEIQLGNFTGLSVNGPSMPDAATARKLQMQAAFRFLHLTGPFNRAIMNNYYMLFGSPNFDSALVTQPRPPAPGAPSNLDDRTFRPTYCVLTKEPQSNCASVP